MTEILVVHDCNYKINLFPLARRWNHILCRCLAYSYNSAVCGVGALLTNYLFGSRSMFCWVSYLDKSHYIWVVQFLWTNIFTWNHCVEMLLTRVRLDLVISTICGAEGTLGIWKMIFNIASLTQYLISYMQFKIKEKL